jgi:hypothetical protein
MLAFFLLPIPYPLSPIPYSLFPIPYFQPSIVQIAEIRVLNLFSIANGLLAYSLPQQHQRP